MTLNYGQFINVVVSFLIVAFAVFLLVKGINNFRKAAEPKTKDCPYCLSQIPVKAVRCGHCTSDLPQG